MLDKSVRLCGRGQRKRSARRQADVNIRRFSGLPHQFLDVVYEWIAHMHTCCGFLQRCQRLRRNSGLDILEHGAAIFAGYQFTFVLGVRITEFEPHQEAVELRLW